MSDGMSAGASSDGLGLLALELDDSAGHDDVEVFERNIGQGAGCHAARDLAHGQVRFVVAVGEVDEERGGIEPLRDARAIHVDSRTPDRGIAARRERVERVCRAAVNAIDVAALAGAAIVAVVFAVDGRLAVGVELLFDASLDGPERLLVIRASA